MKIHHFAILAGVILSTIVGCGRGTTPGYRLHGSFSTVQTLKFGDPVMMAGVEIGYVESITRDPFKAETRVTMHIQPLYEVKMDSLATITAAPSPGKTRITLDGGSSGAPAALDGVILKTREEPGFEIQTHPRGLSPANSRAPLIGRP